MGPERDPDDTDAAPDRPDNIEPPSRSEFWRAFVQIALLSFGGPAGQIAVMHRVLVEERRWISEARFAHAMNYCMLLPGPEAQQLATYAGWLLRGWRGGLAAGLLFIAPGFAAMLALSYLYVYLHQLSLVAALLAGLKAGVFAIVVQALLRIAKRSLHAPAFKLVAVLAFAGIFFFAVPFPLIVLSAGLIGFFLQSGARGASTAERVGATADPGAHMERHYSSASRSPPSAKRLLRTLALWLCLWAGPLLLVAQLLGAEHILAVMALFFSKTALVTFGGAYSVLSYIASRAVESYAWLSANEMLDGLGLAETTPGPLIMVVQFVGFLGAFRNAAPFEPWLAGLLASIVVVWATFAPCFLWIFAGAPYMELLRRNARLRTALAAITAAVSGVILNLTLWFAMRAAFTRQIDVAIFPLQFSLPDPSSADPFMLILMLVGCVLAFRFRLGLVVTLAVCMTLGALRALGGALL